MTATTRTPEWPQPHEFHVQWWRSAIPAVFAMSVFGMLSFHYGIRFAGPGLGLVLLISAANRGGLIISQEGIEWYILRRKWRYRTIPWRNVRDVRKTLFGLLGPIRLIVDHGRYEPWVWGALRADRQIEIAIHTTGYSGGEALWETIHRYWSPRDDRDGVAAIADRAAEPGAAADPAALSGSHHSL